MRQKLFKMIFWTSMSVCLISAAMLAIWMYRSVAEIGVVHLFTPILTVTVLGVALSLLLAVLVSRSATEPLERIDLTRPDERDVEEEIKPLVRRLADQNRQIRSQMEELAREHEKQDKMRRDFTANVSHELKTPLTSISGFAELMRDGLVRQEDVSRFSGKIYEEAQRLIVLVGDIIRLNQLEDSGSPQNPVPVSLYAVAKKVQSQLQAAAELLHVEVTLSGCEGWVLSVPQVVEEILYNLCDNAIKYNRPGGSVHMQIEERGDAMAVSVADTGIGIPEAEQSRIFERFYRVDKSHSREVGGTGLGLSIVKHGAAAVNARIELTSRMDVGTTIAIVFPGSSPFAEQEDADDHT